MILSADFYNDFMTELKREISRINNRAFNGRSSWCAQNFEEANDSATSLLEIDIAQLESFQENIDTKLHKDTYETLYGFQEDEIHEIKSKEFEGFPKEDVEGFEKFEASKIKEIAFIQTYIDVLDETQK